MLPKVSVENPRGRFARVFPWLVLVAAVSVMAWGSYAFTLQTRNIMELNDCADGVRSTRDQTGALPKIVGCRDEWGRAVLYLHNDKHFALVSFGSDGEAAERDYAHLLTDTPPRVTANNCFLTRLDTIVVDSTPWQGCGKGRRDIP
jgi:hypothetical protein